MTSLVQCRKEISDAIHARSHCNAFRGEAVIAAKQVGLRYVRNDRPGISRRVNGQGFRYLDAEGKPLRDEAEFARIKSLMIPPAWTEVWISPWPNGHIQATGRDAKGRKQYRYHPRWRSVRDEAKYERMLNFGKALPDIRRQVDEALKLTGLPQQRLRGSRRTHSPAVAYR